MRALRLAVPTLVLCAASSVADAKIFLDQEEALRLAFGKDARVARKTVFLTDSQLTRVQEAAGKGVAIPGALVTAYSGLSPGGAPLGTAYFDAHRVRTLPETVMIVVSPDGKVSRVEILSFTEPEEYKPRDAWLDQFEGRGLDRDLALRRGVHGITGATLSAEAITEAVRRVLAIHTVLHEKADAP